MSNILFLSHRIPYPPDKGDKIRAWNILKHLATKHRVHLATFIDSPEDVAYVPHLERVCESIFWRELNPTLARLRSLAGFFTGAPLTRGYFSDALFRAGVLELLRRVQPEIIYAFSSAMLPYVRKERGQRVIADLVDVDSEKWRQYAAAKRGLSRWVYRREGRTLLELEREGGDRAEAILLVSRAEAELFKARAPELSGRVFTVPNGVDTDFFSNIFSFPNPFGKRPAIVFTGSMDYWPNIDAMTWFVQEVMPLLRSHPSSPSLWIVGANPAKSVRALAGEDICVTGRVGDVRPYLHHARAVVAPLRIGRGIQNKVLEGMAMGAPLVVSPQAREGLDQCKDHELFTADSPTDFANALAKILEGKSPKMGALARARVATDYSWQDSLATLDRILAPTRRLPPTVGAVPSPVKADA